MDASGRKKKKSKHQIFIIRVNNIEEVVKDLFSSTKHKNEIGRITK
jgi:hypothetical protein